MPKPKKQAPKNSFYFYMKEKQEEYRLKGLNYGMDRMAELAAPSWKEMDGDERAPYEQKAKESKQSSRAGKLDCTGTPIAENARLAEEEKKKENSMLAYINKSLSSLSVDEIPRQVFYFISTQIFCQTDTGVYVPAEIGLVKYSIAEGVMAEYHEFISPGDLPFGYRYSCQEKSERSHHIPVSNFELANVDYDEIIENIFKVIDGDGPPDPRLVLYCYTEEMRQTDYIVNTVLMQSISHQRQRQIKIYDICPLFCHLYGRFADYSPVVVQNEWLRSTFFTYKPNTCCKWHWDSGVYVCALGSIKCYSYIFSDRLLDFYHVEVIPGQHFPDEAHEVCSEPHSWPPAPARHNEARSSSSASYNSSSASVHANAAASSASQTAYSRHDLISPVSFLDSASVCSEPAWGPKSPRVHTPTGFSDRSFATAAMPKQQRSNFEFTKENFPDLNSSNSSTIESSVSIDVSGWRSSSSMSSMSGLTTTGSESHRPLGRGRFLKK